MPTSTRPFVAALALAAACGDATAPLPRDHAPTALHYSSGGFVGYSDDVVVVGDTVVWTRSEAISSRAPAMTRRVPTADEWRAFWNAVRAAGVTRWPARCENADVADGGGFVFELAWDGERRTGSYSNAYPTRLGACSASSAADAGAFRTAVLGLAGAMSIN